MAPHDQPAVPEPPLAVSYDNLPPTRVVSDDELASASQLRKIEVPGYRVGRELGRGGMSVVFQAEHVALQRTVAIKMLLPGLEVPQVLVARFRAEAEAIARLSHPNIIQIFEIGQTGEVPYIVLEFCAGGNLHQRLRGRPTSSAEAVLLIEQLARGIDAAHRIGLVHRDLKPANILFHLDGTAKITDFGLAKNLDSDAQRTRPDAILGTPAYMAPEQAARRHADVGPAADIYALGVILYEMLTGRPPFQSPTELDTLLQVVHDEPVSPRRLQARVPRDLETICLKCLDKDPARRYATAADLADDLSRYREGHTIVARPVGPLVRLGKVMRRHPLVSTLIVLLAGVIAASATSVALSLVKTRGALERELASHRLERRTRFNDKLLLAQSVWHGHDPVLASRYLEEIPENLREWEWRLYRKLFEGGLFTLTRPMVTLPDPQYVNSIALSSDGKYLVAGTGDVQNNLFVWDAVSGNLLDTLPGHRTLISAVAFHPTESLFASAGPDPVVKLWDANTKQAVRAFNGHTGGVLGLAFHPDGKRLISSATDRTIRFWDIASGKEVEEPIDLESVIRSLTVTPDGKTLIAAGEDHRVHLWQLPQRTSRVLKGHFVPVTCVACSSNGEWIASGDKEGVVRLWAAASGEPRFADQAPRQVTSLSFSPDSKRLSVTGGNVTSILEMPSGKQQLLLVGHRAVVSSGVFSRDGRRVFTGSLDTTIKVWDAHSQPPAVRYDASPTPVAALAFSPDEKRLAHAGACPDIRVIELTDPRKTKTISTSAKGIRALVFNPKSDSLAYLAADATAHIIDVRSAGKSTSTISNRPIESLCWCGDELQYIVGGENPRIGRFAPNGKTRDHALPLAGPVERMSFSENGDYFAVAAASHVEVWRAFPPRREGRIPIGKADLVAVNNSGTRLAMATALDRKHCVTLYSLPSGESIFTFLDKTKPEILSFCSNGQRLLSKWGDLRLRSWDAETGQLLPLLEAPKRATRVVVSPTGKHIAFATSADEVFCWDCFDSADPNYRQFLMTR